MVAEALVAELGKTHRAAKILMGWTGAGERTLKRWLAGSHGPRGDHLLVLMGRSDAVFEAVLVAVDRRDAALVARAIAARRSVEEVLGLVEPDRSSLAPADAPAPGADDSETPPPGMTVIVTVTVKMTVIRGIVTGSARPRENARRGFWKPSAGTCRCGGRYSGALAGY